MNDTEFHLCDPPQVMARITLVPNSDRYRRQVYTRIVFLQSRPCMTLAPLYDGALRGWWVSNTLFIPESQVLSVEIVE